MTAAVARPAVAGPDAGVDIDPRRDPVAAAVSSTRWCRWAVASRSALRSRSTGHLDGYPLGLRVATSWCGLGGYVPLWWRRALAAAVRRLHRGDLVSTLSGGLPFVAAFTVAVHRHWPTALVTSTLLALAAWPALLLYRATAMRNTEILCCSW